MKCPQCKKEIIESSIEGLSCLPFCSKRCKLLDLGAWANGDYVISESLEKDDTNIDSYLLEIENNTVNLKNKLENR